MLRQKSKEDEKYSKSQKKSDNQSMLFRGKEENKQQYQPSMLQYNLQKLLNESAERQEKYINFIKEQKQQIFSLTQKYSEVMSRYEKEIKDFISKKQNERNAKRFEKVHRMHTKAPPSKYDLKQYTKEMEYEINCSIKFLYLKAMVEDYLKQTFPSKFTIQFTQYYPNRETKTYNLQLDPQVDKNELIEYMKNSNSIKIFLADMNYACYNFTISHFSNQGSKILKYYKQNQIQIILRNHSTQLLFGYGKIDLEKFLLFDNENENNWLQKIDIVSMEGSDKVIACIYIEMSNSATQRNIPQQHIHKISQPISLARNDVRFHGEKQSRLIHRIHQYKNLHTKIIPQNIKQSTDKNILMHQKRKQLQQIQQYKQANKGNYMQKVFGQAIEQYHTDFIQVGQCKYVHFIYTNHTERHQKVKIKLWHTLDNSQPNKDSEGIALGLTGAAFSRAVEDQKISIQVVSPATVPSLIQQKIIDYPPKSDNCTIDYVIENDYLFVMNGESVLIFVKVILHSLATTKCQLHLQLNNDFGQSLHTGMLILRSSLPTPTHVFPLYTYPAQINQIKIQIPSYIPIKQNFELIGKAKIANVVGCQHLFQFENHWTENYQVLELKITALAKIIAGKTYNCFLFVYDLNYVFQLACFQFDIECTDKLEDQNIQIGRTKTFNIKFKLPPTSSAVQKVMVRLGTSDYLQGCTTISNSTQKGKQFLAEQNVEYPITVCYNTFHQNPISDKLIISCVDTTKNRCVKKMILILKKNNVSFKQIYRLICPINKVLIFDFDLYCSHKEQTTYKLYSSNYSLLTIQEQTPVLFTGQNKKIKLEFRYWKSENRTQEINGDKKTVIFAVDDGKSSTLYLFELEPQNQ